MTFFSRCDSPHRFASGHGPASKRRVRLDSDAGPFASLAGFAEDLGILFRYAAGLDYYGRNRLQAKD